MLSRRYNYGDNLDILPRYKAGILRRTDDKGYGRYVVAEGW